VTVSGGVWSLVASLTATAFSVLILLLVSIMRIYPFLYFYTFSSTWTYPKYQYCAQQQVSGYRGPQRPQLDSTQSVPIAGNIQTRGCYDGPVSAVSTLSHSGWTG
jgi:hypothetical protein